MKQLIYTVLCCSILFSCSKKKGSDQGGKKPLIKSLNGGSERQIFEYDDQGRINRLYYNASSSLKFTYSPAGVHIQRMGSGDSPDPDRKTDFTIVDGRITFGIEYQPDKRTKQYSYGYDDQGRLTQIFIYLKYDGNTYERHQYIMEYDAQNNVKHLSFVRKDNGGQDNSDSVSISKTYYDKKYITWANMGFGYFGTAPMGQEHLGYGIVTPFYLASFVYPSNNALKSKSEDDYYWQPVTKKWVFERNSSGTFTESEYEHDANGRLMKFYGWVVEWQ